MAYRKKEVTKAIDSVEAFVEAEVAFQIFKKSNMPEGMIMEARERLGEHHARLIENRLAEKLLPQARVIVKQKAARKTVLEENTSFGELYFAVGYLASREGTGIPKEESQKAALGSFKSEETKKIWLDFLATQKNDKAFHFLHLLLSEAKWSIVETDLPPVPPRYKIPK